MSKQTEKESAEFKNFREFARKIIAVPKKEIDQQRASYDRKKSKKEKPAK